VRRKLSCLVSLVSLALGVACNGSAPSDFVVHMVDATGQSPFTTNCLSGDVRVDVLQGTNAVLTSHGTLTGSTLGALSVQIPSYDLVTTIEVTVTCNDGTFLIGATPSFLPVGYAYIDVVLGPPGTCRLLSMPVLSGPRSALSLVGLHANVVAIGGLDGEAAPSASVEVIDPMTLTSTSALAFSGLPTGAGRGRAVALGDAGGTQIVLVSDRENLILDTAEGAMAPVTTLSGLHHGVGSESAVVGLNGNGVAIVGGVFDGIAQTGISWIDTNGTVTLGALSVPRRQPGAALVGANELLVVGGQDAGEPLFELVRLFASPTQPSTTFDVPTHEQRYAPVVTTDAQHAAAWVGFGQTAADATGTLLATSWVVTDCSTTCTSITAGPTVAMPRHDVAVVTHEVGMAGTSGAVSETLVIGGAVGTSAVGQIDRITFSNGTVTLGTFGQLANLAGRSAAGAAEVNAGVFLVAGGVDDHQMALQTIEICFPSALEPITIAGTTM